MNLRAGFTTCHFEAEGREISSLKASSLAPSGLEMTVLKWGLKKTTRFLGFFCLLGLLMTGCGPRWKEKFVRRHKETAPPQPVLVLEPDARSLMPAADRYREHFAYWKSWHTGLIDTLGQLRKRDLSQLNGVIGELRAMSALLTGKKQARLVQILNELGTLRDQWDAALVSGQMTISTRTRLEKLFREIARDFEYADVKDSI